MPLPAMMTVGFSCFVMVCVAALSDGACTSAFAQNVPSQSLIEKTFPHSTKCKRCHERVYEEWETSPLAKSIHSPAFRASLDAYLKSSLGGKDKTLCFRCHAPHVREFQDHAQLFVDQAKAGDPSLDGVACSQCHLIKQVDRAKHPPEPKYEIGGKTLYGPYKDFVQNLAHQSMELSLFQKSDLCLNCHQSVPSATNLGKANDLLGNWDQSRAVKSGKECQTCHMPQQVGESANGEKKRTIANHSFPGRIGKLRQEAAKLDVQTRIDGDKTTVEVKVQSLVPHNLPATHPAWATVVLNLEVKGKNLKTVFADKRVYGRTYLDAQGQPTIFDFEAAKVAEDTVLKPEETREETFAFPTPKDTKTFDIEVGLNYAPLSGPTLFIQLVEAESSQGSQDPVFQPIEIVKRTENVPVSK
ncbi:multiheme c-type cytochrome [Candidatus Nitrospira nitrificans]|uniref:Putative Pentaheme cytochrome c n=1 Tax=Candidatus Nitrospira nitrificans TaxID=1742973 RepID=A0A0S4LQX1_9BACT|nr:multiheme c-type cytochrome [Candidatus Nitrospira nitrificans]CUS39905.1 putative Pentaheme cytochrome c [Candidatus Nitrospira nitrificans]